MRETTARYAARPCGNHRDISQNRVFTRSRFFASHFLDATPSGGGSSAIRIASNASVSNPSSRAKSMEECRRMSKRPPVSTTKSNKSGNFILVY